ncbi:MAG: hypothetical protein ABI627_16575 [Polyangiaceae bacterium]
MLERAYNWWRFIDDAQRGGNPDIPVRDLITSLAFDTRSGSDWAFHAGVSVGYGSGPDEPPESAASMGKRRHSVDLPVSPAESSRIDWAQLLKRTYDIDALSCPCGGRLTFIATILEPTVACSILKSLGMEPRPPPTARARSPDWIDDIPVDAQDW